MKILVIAPRFHNNLYYRVQALARKNQVKVLALYKGLEYYKDVEFSVVGYGKLFLLISRLFEKFKKSHLKSGLELRFGWPNKKKLREEIENFSPDVIILKAFQDALSFSVLRLAKKKKIKVIILTQTKKNHIKGSVFLMRLYLRLMKKMGVCCYVSPIQKTKEAFNEIGVKNIHYVPFVYPVKDFDKNYFGDEKINIISVGKFVERKDHLSLLQAINRLKNKYSLKLRLIGERADEVYFGKVEKFIEDKEISNIVEVKSNLFYEDIIKDFEKSDLFILPSYAEPAAYSIVEAMAHKLPVICSDECGTKCYIKEGESGHIFKAGDVDSLIERIEKVIKNKYFLVKMGKNSFEMAKEKHSIEVFEKKFNEILKRC